MFWTIAVIVIAVIAVSLDSIPGKIVAGATVSTVGFLLLAWITQISVLITLAKACAVIVVVTIVGTVLLALIG